MEQGTATLDAPARGKAQLSRLVSMDTVDKLKELAKAQYQGNETACLQDCIAQTHMRMMDAPAKNGGE
jgi:hypothetical protein